MYEIRDKDKKIYFGKQNTYTVFKKKVLLGFNEKKKIYRQLNRKQSNMFVVHVCYSKDMLSIV